MSLKTKRKPLPSQEEIKSKLHYDPETGIMTWISGKLTGKIAGNKTKLGYIRIGFGPNNDRYFAHCLAWVYMTGEDTPEIDHIDNNKSNNKWSNLRKTNRAQNIINRPKSKANSSGYKGVTRSKKTGRFLSRITWEGNLITIGWFSTALEAYEARKQKEIELYGEFHRDCRGE